MHRWAQITLYQKRSETIATIFLTYKSAAQNAQFNFFISEAQRNFRNESFDSVEAQRNFAIAERYFCTKLKRNLTSATEILQHYTNTTFFAILTEKRANNLLKKADICQYYDRKGTKLSSM